ncbi:MAG: Peptidase S74 domain-containing protein [Oscillospiraceae bacterium]|jgi:hypothetical protein
MESIKNEFPHPVLENGGDDYIKSCYFHTSFNEDDISVTTDNIEIPFSYTLVCDGLSKLIQDGKAVVVINVKSRAASYSRLFKFEKDKTVLKVCIPKFDIVKRIEVAGSIIAAEAIPQFSCPGEFNTLYFGNSKFAIRKGDILAKEDSRVIYVDDSELEKPISSIFTINKVSNQDDDIIAEFSDEKIKVNLKEPLYNLYYKFCDFNNGSLRRYVTGIIVYPVLIEAIAKICTHQGSSDGDCRDKRWFRAIEKKAKKIGVEMSDYTDSYATLADKLLGSISMDALKSLKDTLDSEIDSGET